VGFPVPFAEKLMNQNLVPDGLRAGFKKTGSVVFGAGYLLTAIFVGLLEPNVYSTIP